MPRRPLHLVHPAPRRTRHARRAAGVTLGLALAATAAVGCSSDDGDGSGADQATSVSAMLALVPDTKANRAYVLVSLYDQAAEAAGLDPLPSDADRDAQFDRFRKLTSDPETGTGVAPGPIAAGGRAIQTAGRLGFEPGDVSAEITAGRPPTETDVAVGELKAGTVLDRAAEVDGATRRKVDGVEVVSWLDDLRVDADLDTPIGQLPGQAGRVALPLDGVLVYTRADEPMEQAIETVADDHRSLAEDEGLGSVAKSLDRAEVHTAFLSDQPLTGSGRRTPRGAAQGPEPLERYAAVGTGATLRSGRPELVVVLVHRSAGIAKLNVERLQAIVDEGSSAVTGRPWKGLLRKARISRDGRKVVATFEVDQANLWSSLVLQQDTLLATG